MCSLNGKQCAIDNRLVALLVEAQACDLRKQVVQPSSRTRMTVGACHSHIVLAVYRVFGSHGLESFQDAISDSGVSGLGVQDHVYNALACIAGVAYDEGSRVNTLTKTGSDL